MPELPEVETTCRGVAPYILNQTVTQVIIRAPKLRWPIPKQIAKNLPGQIVRAVERRAKYILIKFDTGTLIMHLGMSGRLQTLTTHTPPQKHDHIDFSFSNDMWLRLTDPRRFGAVLWTEGSPLEHKLLINLGPEPFDTAFNSKYILSQAKNKKIAIKKFIMDAAVVVGVGNIYASEALFAAKIDPRKAAKDVTLEQYTILVKHIRSILKSAIAKGGTTLKDFLDTDGKPGYFSQKLKVYGRDKQPCIECNTLIESLHIGQRNTFFCTTCQT